MHTGRAAWPDKEKKEKKKKKRNKEDMFQVVLQSSGASDCFSPSSVLAINEKMQEESEDRKDRQQQVVTLFRE